MDNGKEANCAEIKLSYHGVAGSMAFFGDSFSGKREVLVEVEESGAVVVLEGEVRSLNFNNGSFLPMCRRGQRSSGGEKGKSEEDGEGGVQM
jgi:hypothetical protein